MKLFPPENRKPQTLKNDQREGGDSAGLAQEVVEPILRCGQPVVVRLSSLQCAVHKHQEPLSTHPHSLVLRAAPDLFTGVSPVRLLPQSYSSLASFTLGEIFTAGIF